MYDPTQTEEDRKLGRVMAESLIAQALKTGSAPDEIVPLFLDANEGVRPGIRLHAIMELTSVAAVLIERQGGDPKHLLWEMFR